MVPRCGHLLGSPVVVTRCGHPVWSPVVVTRRGLPLWSPAVDMIQAIHTHDPTTRASEGRKILRDATALRERGVAADPHRQALEISGPELAGGEERETNQGEGKYQQSRLHLYTIPKMPRCSACFERGFRNIRPEVLIFAAEKRRQITPETTTNGFGLKHDARSRSQACFGKIASLVHRLGPWFGKA